MKSIRIDEDVFTFLQNRARPFEDSPNDVLRRVLKLDIPENGHGAGTGSLEASKSNGFSSSDQSRDYTYRSVSGFKLRGRSFPARFWKDVIVNLSNHLRGEHGVDFDKAALKLRGKKRSYFSQGPQSLKFPVPLSGKGLFVETNLSANGIVKISRRLLAELGYGTHEFELN
jgi:negative regulator of replication initiation